MSDLSWLNPTPHAIAVYASQPLSPVATQHSLPSGRYSLTWALRGLEIDNEVQLRGLQHWQIGGFGALEDFSGVGANLPISIGQAGAVTHQTADRAVLAQFIDCRER